MIAGEKVQISGCSPHITWKTGTKPIPKKKILILEDDLCLQPIMTRIVRSIDPNVEVSWAASLTEAFDALPSDPKVAPTSEDLEKMKYSLILADIMLQNLESGLTFWNFCHAHSPATPFAFMSSYSVQDYLNLVKGWHAPPYLRKPFRANDCKEVLQPFLGRT